MNFDTTLTDKMKQTVDTTRLGCGVSRDVGGQGAWLRLVNPMYWGWTLSDSLL